MSKTLMKHYPGINQLSKMISNKYLQYSTWEASNWFRISASIWFACQNKRERNSVYIINSFLTILWWPGLALLTWKTVEASNWFTHLHFASVLQWSILEHMEMIPERHYASLNNRLKIFFLIHEKDVEPQSTTSFWKLNNKILLLMSLYF